MLLRPRPTSLEKLYCDNCPLSLKSTFVKQYDMYIGTSPTRITNPYLAHLPVLECLAIQ